MTTVPTLLSDTLKGHRLTEEDAVALLKTQGREIARITEAADELRERKAGDVVTYVRNQNLHVTNICKNLCGFCGFGRKATDAGAYCHDREGIQAQARLAHKRGVTEICLLSGVHPAFTLDTFTDLIHWVHEAAPGSMSMRSARTKLPMPQKKPAVQRRRCLHGSRRKDWGPSRVLRQRSSWTRCDR